MNPEIQLMFMSGALDGETRKFAPVPPDGIVFGRSTDCAVSLPSDPDASRQHARLSMDEGKCWLEDLGSTNGTFIGEFDRVRRIQKREPITAADVFRIGRTKFRLVSSTARMSATSVAGLRTQ